MKKDFTEKDFKKLELIKAEVKDYHTKKFYDMLIDNFGSYGIYFTALNDATHHGECIFKNTYKHIKLLKSYLMFLVNNNVDYINDLKKIKKQYSKGGR